MLTSSSTATPLQISHQALPLILSDMVQRLAILKSKYGHKYLLKRI